MISISTAALRVLSICLYFFWPISVFGLANLGTDNGFDVGGNESICVVSELGVGDSSTTITNETDPSDKDVISTVQSLLENISSAENNDDAAAETAASALVQSLEKALFARKRTRRNRDLSTTTEVDFGQTEVGLNQTLELELNLTTEVDLNPETVELLSECFNGTFSKLTALDLEPNAGVYVNMPYTFRVNLQMNISDTLEGGDASSAVALFVRFFMCDALEQGLCNPVVDNPIDDAFEVVLVSGNMDSPLVGRFSDERSQIVSPWVLPLTSEIDEDTGRITLKNLDLKFEVPGSARRGLYRFVLHSMLVLLDDDKNSSLVKRVDTATLGDVSVVNVEDEPEILEVSRSLKIVILVLICIYDFIVLVMLLYLFRFRKHNAIKLAQGSFLGALLVAALIGGTFTFTFMPERDAFCIMRGPLVLFPFTTIGAILVARLWRVYVTLSGAMAVGRSTAKSKSSVGRRSGLSVRFSQFLNMSSYNFLQRMIHFLSFFAKLRLFPARREKRKTSRLRKTATAGESAQLVCFLVLPQAVLQTVGNVVSTPSLELQMEDNGRTGRYFCGEPDESWDYIQFTGFFLCAVVYLLAVLLAWQGRELPSVFNEKSSVFQVAAISALLIIFNVALIEITDKGTSSPDSSVFIQTITFLGIATTIVFALVYPKIRRARSGEKVVVGNLLRAYGDPNDSVNNSSGSGGSPAVTASTYIAGAPILLKQDDPLPRNIEAQIHQMHILFRGIGDKCASGIPVSKVEWQQLNRGVAKLKTDLDRVTLQDWDDDRDDVGNPPQNTSLSGTDSTKGENLSSQNASSSTSSSPSCALHGTSVYMVDEEGEGEQQAMPTQDIFTGDTDPASEAQRDEPRTSSIIGSRDLLIQNNSPEQGQDGILQKQKLRVSFDDLVQGE